MAQLIKGLKFHARMNHARLLGELLSGSLHGELSTHQPDCIVTVPLHRLRQRERGFNQALEIARVCAARHALPINDDSIIRTTATGAQSELNAKERRKNLRGAFQLTREIKAEHIVLLDDVVTTGSTVNELAKLLKKARIKKVDVWAMARTP